MALRLRVVSDHRRQLGPRSSMSFGSAGGTIGRSADNDWVLPDPQRYLSGHHVCIRFRQGGYYLEDTSTNGVYVNDAEQPLPKHAPYELHDGDLLRFGDYQIVASVDVTMELTAEPSAIFSVDRINGTGSVLPAPQSDLGASLNLQALLAMDSSPSDSFGPVDAFGQAAGAPIGRPREVEEDEPSEDSIARRVARLARAAAARERASAPALYDVASGLQAFCRGAGIEAETLPADAQTRLLHLAGQLCREALLGLKDLERSQQELRNRFRIESVRDPEDPRPSLASGSIEELLTKLLAGHEVRRADAVQWLREEFERAKAHQTAAAAAMRAAFVEFIGRLDPAELEGRFERAAKRSLLAGKVQHWSLYRDFYRSLTEMPADHLPHLFVETFAGAYRRELEER